MFNEMCRYIGFPNQLWCESDFAFKSFEKTFKNKVPFFVSTFAFKDKETPIIDNLFFDIDSYFSLRIPYRNVKVLKEWCRRNNLEYIINFSVTGDTPILIKIDNSIKLLPISTVIELFKSGMYIEVLSYDNKIKFSPIYDYLEHNDNIYELYHEQSNIPLKITNHHSIYKWNKSEISCVKRNDINIGDFLVSFNKFEKNYNDDVVIKQKFLYWNNEYCEDIKITDDLLKLIGYYISEGHLSKSSQIGFSFHVNEIEYQNEVKDLLSKLVPEQIYRKGKQIYKKEKLNVYEQLANKNKSEKQIYFSSYKYKSFFNEQCGTGAKNKHLPPFIFDMSKEKFLLLLTCYLNGDGSYKCKYEIPAKTISKQLAEEILWMCKLHGITCTIRMTKPQKWSINDFYIISINKSELNKTKNNKFHPSPRNKLLPVDALLDVYYQCKPQKFNNHRVEQVTLYKKAANHERILKVIKWFDKYKSFEYTEKSKKIIDNYLNFIHNENLSFLKIRKIIDIKNPIKVYDISVVGSENFFGGSYPILLHNSGAKGFHLYILFKPIIPVSPASKDTVQTLMYSVQMRIAEETKIEAYDEPTFARLRFLCRYPTSLYWRRDDETGKMETSGFYCRYLTDEEFDSGLKRISHLVKEPGIVPKAPRPHHTLQEIADLFPNFKIRHRQDINISVNLQRNGMEVPTLAALGLPCLQELSKHSHPTHFERIELVSFLKFLGYTDLSINAFIRNCNWTRYSYNTTAYQVGTIKPRMVKCSFLKQSYIQFCDKCTYRRTTK